VRRGIPELEDLGSLQGRRVLVRADLNVPLATKPDGAVVVADDFRLRASRPTIDWLRAQGAEVERETKTNTEMNKIRCKYIII
jgi:phosphoglycerate kinase